MKAPRRPYATAGLLALLAAFVAGLAFVVAPGGDVGTPRADGRAEGTALSIMSGGRRHDFSIEVALTEEQRGKGLMFRRSMPAKAGMLFSFDPPQRAAMWMRNTYIPLDMLFVDARGRIVHIAERTTPMSDDIVSAGRPVSGVLELNGGTADRLQIRPGDTILHALFGNAP